jgi:antitoxin component YwqK of YwqJK toxin-antitoxin module
MAPRVKSGLDGKINRRSMVVCKDMHPAMMKIKKRFIAMGAACLLFPFFDAGTALHAQVFRGYYPGGGVQLRANTQDKKKIIKGYYPGGSLEVVYEYEKGKLNGTTRQYYENGVLKAEINYIDDKRNGTAKYYYPNGKLMARLEYKNNVETGVSRYYDESGKLITAPK